MMGRAFAWIISAQAHPAAELFMAYGFTVKNVVGTAQRLLDSVGQ